MIRYFYLLILLIIMVFPGSVYTQVNKDSTNQAVVSGKKEIPEPYHRNTIKFNPTPMLIQTFEFRNITFSYERLTGRRTSVAFQAGYLLLPAIDGDSLAHLAFITGRSRYGINLAFDYRYYLMNRNCRPAPDGLYIGGYLSYYGYNFKSKLNISKSENPSEGELHGSLNIVNLGFEFGYQFVFNKRWTLDLLLFGPSLSLYSGKMEIDGALTEEEMAEIDQDLLEKLREKVPVLGALFSPGTREFGASTIKFGSGFRYSVQVGFHF